MPYNFRTFLKSKGFKSTKYGEMTNYEFEKKDPKGADGDKIYFAITIHGNGLMTSGRSDKKGLYNKDAELPETEAKAKTFLSDFLK